MAQDKAKAGKTTRSGNPEKQPETQPRTPPATAGKPRQQAGGGKGLAGLALAVAVAAAAGAGYLGYRLVQTETNLAADQRLEAAVQDLERQTTTMEQLQSRLETMGAELRDSQKALDEALGSGLKEQSQALAQARTELAGSLENRTSRLEARMDDMRLAQSGMGQTLEVVRQAVASGGDRNAWTLSEVDYLLQIANNKLRLEKNVHGAIEALQLAELKLGSLNELAFEPIVGMIKEDLASLRGVERLDRADLAHRIAAMAKQVDALPIRNEVRTAAKREQAANARADLGAEVDMAEEKWYEKVLLGARQELNTLVRVTPQRYSGPPLIAPEEEYFLTENLRLKLEAMRVAALEGNGPAYQESLELSRTWLQTYFDPASEAVAATLNELEALQRVKLQPYLPDISDTLAAFDDVMKARKPLQLLPPAGRPEESSAEDSV